MTIEDKTILSDSGIEAELATLENWKYHPATHEIQRVWHFEKFVPAMALTRQITEVMDANNHHSDLRLDSRMKTLTVTVTTHSENAITRADIEFARAVDAIE